MKSNKLIWILEDDEGSKFVYQEILEYRHRIKFFSHIEEFDKSAQSPYEENKPDLLIADLRLTDGNFLTYLHRRVKNNSPLNIQFIVVSSLDDLDVLRKCFEYGALDYLTKPFTKNELIIKVERFFSQSEKSPLPQSDSFIINPNNFTVTLDQQTFVHLTSKELQILTYLNRSINKIATRDELQKKIWDQVSVTNKTLDVHIFHLRKKLSPLGLKIEFHPREGYRLLGNGMR